MAVKNLKAAFPVDLINEVTYSSGSIVSKTIASGPSGTITLFAFDQGQSLSEHTAPFDALAHMLDGKCRFMVAGQESVASAGQIVFMPANAPHALEAVTPFKMLLTMLKEVAGKA